MDNEFFSVTIQETNGTKVWESDDLPRPNDVNCGTAHYSGQKNVEYLLKLMNQKAFINHEERFVDPFFSIFESSLEQGVENEGTIQWDDRSFYTRISWASYTWKLPPEIKKRIVQIDISRAGETDPVSRIKVPISKIANDGGDILISPRIISKLKLKNGSPISVRIRFF